MTDIVAMQPNIFSSHNNLHAQQNVGIPWKLELAIFSYESIYHSNFNTRALILTQRVDINFDYAHLHLSAILQLLRGMIDNISLFKWSPCIFHIIIVFLIVVLDVRIENVNFGRTHLHPSRNFPSANTTTCSRTF